MVVWCKKKARQDVKWFLRNRDFRTFKVIPAPVLYYDIMLI